MSHRNLIARLVLTLTLTAEIRKKRYKEIQIDRTGRTDKKREKERTVRNLSVRDIML